MAYESILTEALELSKTFEIYPLSSFSNIPLKGSSGELDATKDHETIFSWFEKEPLISIGLSLKDSNVLVIDVDDHNETGEVISELAKLTNGNSLEDAVIVKTPRGQGFHAYYRYPSNVTIENDSNFRNGIEILTTKVTAPCSRKTLKDGTIGEYELKTGSLSDIRQAPDWLLNAIVSKQQVERKDGFITLNFNDYSRKNGKKYTAILLEEIVKGVTESERNVWLTKITGKFLALGTEPAAAYQLISVINENFISPPLDDKEVNAIFKSIVKKERKKREVG